MLNIVLIDQDRSPNTTKYRSQTSIPKFRHPGGVTTGDFKKTPTEFTSTWNRWENSHVEKTKLAIIFKKSKNKFFDDIVLARCLLM